MNSRRGLLLSLLLMSGCGFSFRTPLTVLVPEGYTGWVRVEYNVASASPFSKEEGRRVLRIPPSGFARTSSSFEPGIEGDIYAYVSPDGKQTPLKTGEMIHIPRMFTVNVFAEKPRMFGAFFVGSDAEFAKATKDPSSLPVPDLPGR